MQYDRILHGAGSLKDIEGGARLLVLTVSHRVKDAILVEISRERMPGVTSAQGEAMDARSLDEPAMP